ncbi:MAG: adenosine kinase [Myxococcota bacterium]
MSTREYDVVGIGNAIVDVLGKTDDAYVEAKGLPKGAMSLIDEEQAERLFGELSEPVTASGGSAGNTMAGIASLGGSGAYVGKVRDDVLGQAFRKDIREIGVDFDTAAATDGPSTARCIILVTPDAQRTMATYLGACVNLTSEDVDHELVRASKVTYLEGYLFDPPEAKRAFIEAAEVAHEAGRQISLTLSDTFCVDRHRAAFRELVSNHVDILFANEAEILSLYETSDFDQAVREVQKVCQIAALTRSEKGSLILEDGGQVHEVRADPIDQLVDTTGAGDLYASGFLFGFTHGKALPVCGQLGSVAAGEVISHVGARPLVSLRELAQTKLSITL